MYDFILTFNGHWYILEPDISIGYCKYLMHEFALMYGNSVNAACTASL
jgi:hypothetical protein